MAKPIPIKGKDGKFAGSIGVGRDSIPTASEVTTGSAPQVEQRKMTPVELLGFLGSVTPADMFNNSEMVLDRAIACITFLQQCEVNPYTALSNYRGSFSDFKTEQVVTVKQNGLVIVQHGTVESPGGPLYGVVFPGGEGKPHLTGDVYGLMDLRGRTKTSPAVLTPLGVKYYSKGVLHRQVKEGPAVIRRGEDGRVVREAWAENGKVVAVRLEDGVLRDREGNPLKGLKLWWLTFRRGLNQGSARGEVDGG